MLALLSDLIPFHFATRCQPWTIVLTGVSVTASSWLILHSIVVTVVILLLICTWWYIFLYSYPKVWASSLSLYDFPSINSKPPLPLLFASWSIHMLINSCMFLALPDVFSSSYAEFSIAMQKNEYLTIFLPGLGFISTSLSLLSNTLSHSTFYTLAICILAKVPKSETNLFQLYKWIFCLGMPKTLKCRNSSWANRKWSSDFSIFGHDY